MAAYGKSEHPKVQLDGRSLGLPVVHQSGDDEFLLDIGDVNTADVDELLEIFEEVLKDGQSYPQESTTRQAFVDYFFGLYTFVVRSSKVSTGSQKGKVVAGFYIKSNFPGRSSHLANYGIMVHSAFRGKGLANFMVEQCVRLAPLVGFKALYTNLVYTTNIASIKTCQKYGFSQVGRVPKAGLLKGLG
ncbi:PREDICTED: L-azetidine-2-carboxylic acid acetyltransferase-like, partial [Rhagoletis zephyria]|uniref:L-azetidine-2-carboxylic acid acetyltransferase-like n=1 Tax=Rhagoletis zephyria TaxID=28612 RepID=UPI00081152E9